MIGSALDTIRSRGQAAKSEWHAARRAPDARQTALPWSPEDGFDTPPEGDLFAALGARNDDRRTVAPPRFPRLTSDCGPLVFRTGRKRLKHIGVMENRK